MKLDVIKWLWYHSAGHHKRLFKICVWGVVRVVTGLAFVEVSRRLIDAVSVRGADSQQVTLLSISLVSLLLLEMAFSFVFSYLSSKTEIRMKIGIKAVIYNHLLGTRWDVMGRIHSGDLLNRITEDVGTVTGSICGIFPSLVMMLFQFVAVLTMLFVKSWKLALCGLCIMPFFLILSRAFTNRTRKMTAAIRRSDSNIQSCLQEGLQHRAVVQTLECEDEMGVRLSMFQSLLYNQTLYRARFGIFSGSVLRIGIIACYATTFLWCISNLRTGAITFGMMTAFIQLVSRLQNSMVSMTQLIPSFAYTLSSIDRLKEIEMLPSEQKGKSVMLNAPIGIRITDMSFRYEQDSPNIFDRFSYDFKPGSKTILMGETGVGKSTLIRLLLALLHPQAGKIELYSDSVAEVSAATRCNMVYVPQGNSLLEGTIRSNLLLGDPKATEEMMYNALYIAAAEFVKELPDKLDTYCGESGGGLSEGQSQRIAIARALLRKGSIILLDEFNSALDEETACTLMERLMSLSPNNTVIFISHRTEVSQFCDAVLRLGGDKLS